MAAGVPRRPGFGGIESAARAQGAISQVTGEDWTNVRLKLSTGQPRLSPQGTEARPWKLALLEARSGLASGYATISPLRRGLDAPEG